jgi:hypothetical protein
MGGMWRFVDGDDVDMMWIGSPAGSQPHDLCSFCGGTTTSATLEQLKPMV